MSEQTDPRLQALARELRTDHAGETGAVMIYRGILAVSRDPAVRAFAQHHQATEQQHLELIEALQPTVRRSRLLPLWRLSGWLTGALPALFGARAVYATIEAVETFVDRHYAEQVELVDAILAHPRGPLDLDRLIALRALLERCRLDEVAHRDDAASRQQALRRTDPAPGWPLRLWTLVVGTGSQQAVKVCRWV